MFCDNLLELCDGTTITATVASAIIGDVIDLGASPTLKNLGAGETAYLVITIDTAVVSTAGSATVAFYLYSDSTANLATSATTHYNSGNIPKATLVEGYKIVVPLPANETYERYLGLFAETKVSALDAGACSAYITLDAPNYVNLPDAL